LGDQVREDEMGKTCSTYILEMTIAYKISVRKRNGKRPLGKTRRIWEDNIKVENRVT